MKTLTKWLTGIIFVMSASVLSAQVDTAQSVIWSVRTQSRVGLNPAAPMVSEYAALPIYYTWMKELAACEGLKLPPIEQFAKTRYIQVNADDFQINADHSVAYYAVTVPDSTGTGIMYISLAHYIDSRIVKHEDLHILLYYNFPDGRYTHDPAKQHPSAYFGKCDVKPN